MSNIVYVGAFRFPDKDAASKRVYSIGCILRDLGYAVVFAGGQQGDNVGEEKQYKGFPYYSLGELDKENKNIFSKVKSFFQSGDRTIDWLENYTQTFCVDKIIVYNSSNIFLKKMMKFCKKRDIELICDITEWYESSHLPGGKYGLVAIDNMLKMHFTYKEIKKKIVISSFLNNNYNSEESKNIIVPPLFVEPSQLQRKKLTNKVNILYAGTPGKKDCINTLLAQYIEHENKFPMLFFNILGISKAEFEKCYDIKVKGNIKFYGQVAHSEVIKIYSQTHFSFFVREDKRYANAGFPTKFVESMSQVTPVITNITSDIGCYMKNGVNGYVLEDLSSESIIKLLHIINGMTDDIYQNIQEDTYIVSEKFYYESYKDALRLFI